MALHKPDSGYMDHPKGITTYDTMIIDNVAHKIKKTVVHRFLLGDVEDPDLYAAEPLINWRESEMGKWVMAKAVDTPEWHRYLEPVTYGYQYAVVAKLKEVDYTFWQLKWGNNIDTTR